MDPTFITPPIRNRFSYSPNSNDDKTMIRTVITTNQGSETADEGTVMGYSNCS